MPTPTSLLPLLALVACISPAKADDRPKSVVTVSKETTHATGPLKADGSVDFVEALNRRVKEGVTLENNAAVPLWRAFGPREIPQELRAETFRRLEIDPLPVEGDYFVSLDEFAKRQDAKFRDQNTLSDAFAALYEAQGEAMGKPWAKADQPTIAAWLAANEKPVGVMVEASRRERFYSPILSAGDPPTIVSGLLPLVQQSRETSRVLTARAMLAVHEDRFDDARRDLLASHRLARLVGSGPTVIEALVAVAMDAITVHADAGLVRSGKFTAAQLQAYRQELAQLPPLPRMAEKVDLGERFLFLDVVQMLAHRGPDALEELAGDDVARNPVVKWAMGQVVDWDTVLRRGNKHYDTMVAAMSKPTHAERVQALDELDAQTKEMLKRARSLESPIRQFAILLSGNLGQQVTQSMGDVLFGLLVPALQQAHVAETRGEANSRMGQVALALGAYQRKQGGYPEKLAALVPDFLAELPQDPFTDQPFRYEPQAEGFRLYSVGANGQDDGGVTEGKPDDVALP